MDKQELSHGAMIAEIGAGEDGKRQANARHLTKNSSVVVERLLPLCAGGDVLFVHSLLRDVLAEQEGTED